MSKISIENEPTKKCMDHEFYIMWNYEQNKTEDMKGQWDY